MTSKDHDDCHDEWRNAGRNAARAFLENQERAAGHALTAEELRAHAAAFRALGDALEQEADTRGMLNAPRVDGLH